MTAQRVQDVISRVCERRQAGREASSQKLERLKLNLTSLKRNADNLLNAVAEGTVGDSDHFRDKYQRTLQQRDHVQRLVQIEEQQMKDEMRAISDLDAEVAACRLRIRLESASKEFQKRLLRALIGEIVVYPDQIIIRGPDPDLADTANAALESEDFPLPPVQAFDREWRTGQDENGNWVLILIRRQSRG